MVVAIVPAVGFAVLFNVPKRFLKYCGFAAFIGFGIRSSCVYANVPIEIASLAGAFAVGSLAMYWSRRFLAPTQVFAVAAVIPMIPGKYAFGFMVTLIEMNVHNRYAPELVTLALSDGLKTVFILISLAFGIAAPRLLFYRPKPAV
ncbi:threonine/serine exporter family protein [Neiella sp. HB171785]|uniref:Threonine/serine exporter family protein n=2 Tax=Neiella litorisoli TaxID=2771431 RepID=A0A8J6QM40_9GAMM|nr:threonine/serine exporter family protein [Neiella litorisoli]